MTFDPTQAPPPPWPRPGNPMQATNSGAIGHLRPTGMCILLTIVTLGIYQYVWFYKVHDEMKRHSGQGMGGGLALVVTIFLSIIMPYITASEVGDLYSARGQQPPVTGLTGLWSFPGALLIVGPLVWFIKTNNALNNYWASLGATTATM